MVKTKRKQLLKYILILDFIILSLIIGGIYYVESDGPRQRLEDLLSNSLHAKVIIGENLDFKFYPWVGVNTGHVVIDWPLDSGVHKKVEVDNIELKVKLASLFKRELEVDTILVNSPQIEVVRFSKEIAQKEVEKRTFKRREAQNKIFKSVYFRGLHVSNATVSYIDKVGKGSLLVSGLSLRTGILERESPVAFDLVAKLDADDLDLSGQLGIKGLLNLSLKDKKISISESVLNIHATSSAFADANVVDGFANLEFDFLKGNVGIENLTLQGLGARFYGRAEINKMYDSPQLSGHLSALNFDPKTPLYNILGDKSIFKFRNKLRSSSISTHFYADTSKVQLTSLTFKVDDTTLKGKVSLKNYQKPFVNFDVGVDKVNLSKYADLSNLKKVIKKQSNKKTIIASFRDRNIPDLIKELPCRGIIKIGDLSVKDVRMKNIGIEITPENEILKLKVPSGEFFDGKFSFESVLSRESKKSSFLKLNGKGHFTPVSLAKLPRRVSKIKIIGGRSLLTLNKFKSYGSTLKEISRNFTADMNIKGQNIIANIDKDISPTGNKYKVFIKDLNTDLIVSPFSSKFDDRFIKRHLKIKLLADAMEPKLNMSLNYEGDISINRQNFDEVLFSESKVKVRASGKAIPVLKGPVEFYGVGWADLNKRNIHLSSYRFVNGGVTFYGAGDISNYGLDSFNAIGKFNLNEVSCSKVFSLFGLTKPVTRNPKAFDKIMLFSDYVIDSSGVKLKLDKFGLDNSTLKGKISLNSFKKLLLNFDVKADQVNVDDYLEPKEYLEKERIASRRGQASNIKPWEFADDLLNSIHATGKIECGKFRIFDFSSGFATADVRMEDSIITIKNLKSKFHNGTLAGKIGIGLKKGEVLLDTDLEGRNFSAGSFFTDYIGKPLVTGAANVSVKLSGVSSARKNMVDTLSGIFAFKIENGSYYFNDSIDKTKKIKKGGGTKFSVMQGTMSGNKGNFTLTEYLLKTAYMTARGNGGFNIPRDVINVHLKADIVQVPNLYLTIVNALFDALTGVDISVTGRLSDPHIKVNGLKRWNNVLGDVLGLPEQSFSFFKKIIF